MQRGVRELRIIGGTLRGRKWTFAEAPGLRPTPDRVRETLFNWLAPHLPGARVLDLFAGSGALGFEALSRGAASAVLVERERVASDALRATAGRFGLSAAFITAGDGIEFLRSGTAQPFDLIFLDPPFGAGLVEPALETIANRQMLAPGGFCYLEQPASAALPVLPAHWAVHRSRKAGEVGYHLLHDPSRDLPGDL